MTAQPRAALAAALTVALLWVACSGDPPGTPGCPPGGSCGDVETPCATVADCPAAPDHRCGEATCIEGVCGVRRLEVSTSQAPGDCKIMKCGPRSVGPEIRAYPEDVYESVHRCIVFGCSQGHVHPRYLEDEPAADGIGFCDKDHRPVECLTAEHCDDPALVCSERGKCVPPSCTNSNVDPSLGEVGPDCGGPCDLCPVDYPCVEDADCSTKRCGADKACMEYSCDDGLRNGPYEPDVDCGGLCDRKCGDGKRCVFPEECESKICLRGVCQAPTCHDARQNGAETDIDCGGDCPPCP